MRSVRSVIPPAIAIVLVACSLPSGLDEPYHKLRPATYWIKELGRSHIPNEIWGRSSPAPPIEALRRMGPAAVPACIRALAHRQWHVRAGAAHALSLYGPAARDAVPALAVAVCDREDDVRSLAVDALAEIGADARTAVPSISQRLTDEAIGTRIAAAYALARIDPPNDAAVEVLIEGLGYVDVAFREALRRHAGADWQKRGNVMEIQTRDGQRILNHEDGVRNSAALALGRVGPSASRAIPALTTALGDEHSGVQHDAIDALGRMGPAARSAVPALIDALASGNSSGAALALGRIGFDPTDLPLLLRALKNPDNSRLRAAAARVLGEIQMKDENVVTSLRMLLEDEDPAVREAARTALRTLDPKWK
jgi:HEAT repeat protein